jgi:hypothetical protein
MCAIGDFFPVRQAVWQLVKGGDILRAVDLSAVPSLRFPSTLLSASSILRSATMPSSMPLKPVGADDVDVGMPGAVQPHPPPPRPPALPPAP